MLKEEGINLCLALYRITELFPQEEPLRLKLREAGLNVVSLAVWAEDNHTFFEGENVADSGAKLVYSVRLRGCFGALYALMDVARSQKWVRPRNFDILAIAYGELERKMQDRQAAFGVRNEVVSRKPSFHQRPQGFSSESLNMRQKKLLAEIKGVGATSPRILFAKFSQVNPRTILRDIEKLEALHLIKGKGSTRSREYDSID